MKFDEDTEKSVNQWTQMIKWLQQMDYEWKNIQNNRNEVGAGLPESSYRSSTVAAWGLVISNPEPQPLNI